MTAIDIPAEKGASVSRRVMGVLLTLAVVCVASILGWRMWETYMTTPWTRDGTVRAYVVAVAPQISGRIVELPVKADQFVHKGDLLMVIEPSDYQNALASAEASVAHAKADLENKKAEAERRTKLSAIAASEEEKQSFAASADMAVAAYQQALADRDQAKLNLSRTRIVSLVNGYVTNLLTQVGDYGTSGQRALSVVDSDSFWVDGYFEETVLSGIHVGDKAKVALMAYPTPLTGHVTGIGRGIAIPNVAPDVSGLASVNPVFTWVRLAQRVPVRIALDPVPPSVTLSAGLTATVTITGK
ncbi:HlyD family secretion protein [Xanthobacter aminoxidans]|uniref:HlyD family efflux transporter periplasmic adaptor subunit n=1 Tax=Xanthobacter aminoxidans TaxID=186280 RepID=UPI00372BFAAC